MSNEYGIEIGEASTGGGIAKNFRLKDGENNIYRILPPLGKLAAKGTWAVDWAVHWGYKSGDDKHRLFKCIEERNRDTKMVTKRCPECDKNARLKAGYEAKFKEIVEVLMKQKNMGKEAAEKVAKAKLQPQYEVIRTFNRGFRFYVNAINEKMEIGVLNISYSHFKLLRTRITELTKEGISFAKPSQGAWFNFTYEGASGHAVEVVMVGSKAEGQKMKPAALTEDVLKRLKNEVGDLTTLFKELTFEQIDQLVKSNGDTGVVDSIFSRGEKTKTDVDVGGDDLNIPGIDDTLLSAAANDTPAEAPKTKAREPDAIEQGPKTPVSPPDVDISDADFDNLFGKL